MSTPLDFEKIWSEALTWTDFLIPGITYYELWEGVYRRATVSDEAVAAANASRLRRILVISEDWCGDAVNPVPVLVRLTEKMTGAELRLLPRDQHLDVMDRYLTNGNRSIPIIIGLDAAFRELGHWGPRASELQAWVMANKATKSKDERYAEVRRWYARDQGVTTVREILAATSGS